MHSIDKCWVCFCSRIQHIVQVFLLHVFGCEPHPYLHSLIHLFRVCERQLIFCDFAFYCDLQLFNRTEVRKLGGECHKCLFVIIFNGFENLMIDGNDWELTLSNSYPFVVKLDCYSWGRVHNLSVHFHILAVLQTWNQHIPHLFCCQNEMFVVLQIWLQHDTQMPILIWQFEIDGCCCLHNVFVNDRQFNVSVVLLYAWFYIVVAISPARCPCTAEMFPPLFKVWGGHYIQLFVGA